MAKVILSQKQIKALPTDELVKRYSLELKFKGFSPEEIRKIVEKAKSDEASILPSLSTEE